MPPPPTPPSNPSAVVSGAGSTAANGTYTPRGTQDGKPYYNLVGQPDSLNNFVISWVSTTTWQMTDFNGNPIYFSNDDVAFPWLATWETDEGQGGVPPAPTVTHS